MALRPQTQPLLLLELGDVIALPVTVFPVVKQKRKWLTGYPRTKASPCSDLCRPLPGGGAEGPSKSLQEL